eukprot:3672148-Rhodomonas_salina.1
MCIRDRVFPFDFARERGRYHPMGARIARGRVRSRYGTAYTTYGTDIAYATTYVVCEVRPSVRWYKLRGTGVRARADVPHVTRDPSLLEALARKVQLQASGLNTDSVVNALHGLASLNAHLQVSQRAGEEGGEGGEGGEKSVEGGGERGGAGGRGGGRRGWAQVNEELFKRLHVRAAIISSQLKAKGLSNVLWSMGTTRIVPDPTVLAR